MLKLDFDQDQRTYANSLKLMDKNSPFYSLSFFINFSEGLKNLICFKWQQNEKLILLPGYLTQIEKKMEVYDFRSPYGYSGPLCSGEVTSAQLVEFWKNVNTSLQKFNVVTSFIRFSLDNNNIGFTGALVPTLLNVKGKIISEEKQWKNFEPKVRKNVNKALREGLTYKVVKGNDVSANQIKSFYNIYTNTLSRNSATKGSYAALNDFLTYVKAEGDSCLFVFVFDGIKMVAAEMILLSNDTLYSFLGGTLQSAFDKRANDFLKYNLIYWARNNGHKHFVLGGGLQHEDGIFKFKKSFFPNDIVTFYTGQQVFDQVKYQELCNRQLAQLGDKEGEKLAQNHFFPAYRFKEYAR